MRERNLDDGSVSVNFESKKIFRKILFFSFALCIIESVVGIVLRANISFILSVYIGYLFMGLGLHFMIQDTLKLKKVNALRRYYSRYFFYASGFLLSVIIFKERTLAILGTFLGMLNYKITLFLGWRWYIETETIKKRKN